MVGKICYTFAERGSCRFKNCRFEHVRQPGSQSPPNRAKRQDPRPDQSGEFGSWKRQAPGGYNNRPLGARLGPFFKEARRLIEVDESTLQNVVRWLSNEGGLRRIQELIQRDFSTLSKSMKSTTFHEEMLPFLELVTFPEVLSSLVLEQAVVTIYNCIFGPGGRRGEPFLGFLAEAVETEIEKNTSTASGYLEVSLLVFSQVVELNSTAFIQEPLKPIAQRFADILTTLHALDSACSVHQSYQYLERLQRRLDIGLSLPNLSGTLKKLVPTQKTVAFITQRDPPGGRHDNDHADICNIRIMPTFDEISSSRSEYLPPKDPRQWHVPGLAGLLDRNFRLLREDTIGQLRDVIHAELQPGTRQNGRRNQTRTHVYKQVTVHSVAVHRHSGMQFLVGFSQPPNLRGMNSTKRREWWKLSKRLQESALVCLLDPRGFAIFCTVSTADRPNGKVKSDPNEQKLSGSLSESGNAASVVLELVEPTEDNWQYILDCQASRRSLSVSLVEFPGILLPSFQPTLLALQKMQKVAEVSMSEFLAPHDLNSLSLLVDVPPPVYTTTPGFSFDLKCLMDDNTSLQVRHSQPVEMERLKQHSTLDNAQAEALVSTLQRRIGLIQGPPGTGKSYTGVALIKVLLANKKKVTKGLGPIICVCYTNHALDQLLEDVLDHDITSQIIRIGSQSKSERLQPLNLRKVVQDTEKTRSERHGQWELHKKFDSQREVFQKLHLNATGSEISLKFYLQRNHPNHYRQLFEKDDEGWQEQRGSGQNNVIWSWLNGGKSLKGQPRAVDVLRAVHVNTMTAEERKTLYDYWLETQKVSTHSQAQSVLAEHLETKSSWDRIRDELDLRCLRSADIIGLTTTGLARNLNMLRRLRSRVLICEEAGEVLEAHLLTSLLPSVEHVILIGDHQQLRPQIQNYGLSRESNEGKQYSLDRSLFERLVEPDEEVGVQIPFCTLETQRRMFPSISRLVRDTLYPRLQDALSVSEYPEVPGMRKRLYWLDHRQPEGGASNQDPLAASRWNDHEIDLTVSLVNHLLSQGVYESGDIAVLTPYLGQLHRMRRKLAGSFIVSLGERDEEDLDNAGFEGDETQQQRIAVSKSTLLHPLRVATVDNFQGEEAKVVVISLVRSNSQNRCGFLRTPNRINVLLSRAKHGMYIIGNSETSRGVEMWGKVLEILEEDGNIGPHLELSCPRHPETPIAVTEPEHFVQFSPEGGCSLQFVYAILCYHAGIIASVIAQSVSSAHPMVQKSIMHAFKSVDGHTPHAPMAAMPNVTGRTLVFLVLRLVMFNVAIPDAPGNVLSHVLLVQFPSAYLHVHTALVPCLVPRLAIIFRAHFDFCQTCASDEIKDTPVDFILGESYREINLAENPCIFPQCGHFLTVESMDAQMDLKKHYVMDDMEKPISISSSSEPFSIEDIRTCATCRGSLRSLSRYGRLVRRSLLDEATKKFILYLNQQYVPLAQELPAVLSELQLREGAMATAIRVFQGRLKIELQGPANHQVSLMSNLVTKNDSQRWKEILTLRFKIAEYQAKVKTEEQPFSQVHNMVENARRRKKTSGKFAFDENVLQTKGQIQATALLLRLDTALLGDFLSMKKLVPFGTDTSYIQVNLKENRKESLRLIKDALDSHRILQQAEGNIFFAQLCALERQNASELTQAETLFQEGNAAIEEAQRLCGLHPGQTRGLLEEIEGTKSMLGGATFYTPVTNAERLAILAAMATEFRGTGHWYYCENGHPFTIGECGAAMELSRCPECGSAVGGQHHQTTNGVTHAQDLEARLRDLRIDT
ncbi:hypothetical protein N7494_007552 [Penicillium frequentans]|uniref:NFX1-type zinc finger-containing protein 1 n=1 Tax=Penicillium frequentans TaxID=3151616 RepID=A0AAD6CT22_9EURO|nr:hypothetical protein N7494_007552 [Penicillium glabrum]